jgi:hypothetical protein
MPDFSIAIAMLKKPIEELYTVASGAVKDKIAGIKTASKMQNLHKRLWESQRVKTIWHTERPMSLGSLFYPVNVIRQDNGQLIESRFTSLSDLPENHNIIFGTVGQGKSILLKFLLGKEIKSGTRIPVFCELRNVGEQSLETYLAERFAILLGTSNDQMLFDTFASNGKISFFLDGFDEIEPANIQKLMQEIEDLAFKYAACRILLSSRPDSECRHLTSFHTNRIAQLSSSDLEPFYKKITRDQEFTNRLVAAVKASPLKIRELVNTPLLATLLAISYRAAHKIPLDFAEFYEELFQILLVRHDGAKLGWRRYRKTKLNDREIQQAFEAFCFATRKKQLVSIEKEAAYQYASESLSECQLTADPTHFLEDIKKITCLLTDEGKKFNFVHASVQEFFAARYIKTRAETVAQKFYQQLVNGKWAEWQEEILFLQQIDTHRASKYFKIPDLDRTLRDIKKSRIEINSLVIEDYLNGLSVRKTIREGKEVPSFIVVRKRAIHTYHYANIDARAFSILFAQGIQAKAWNVGFIADPQCESRTYLELAKDREGSVLENLTTAIAGTINSLVSDYENLKSIVKTEETVTQFMDLG